MLCTPGLMTAYKKKIALYNTEHKATKENCIFYEPFHRKKLQE